MLQRKALIKFLILLTILFLNYCSSNQQMKDNEEKISKIKLKEIADERFGNKHYIHYNKDSSYAIVKKQTKARKNEAFLSTTFFIYEIGNEEILYEEVIHRGDVKWFNNNLVEINSIPGIIKGDESMNTKSYYDVLSKKKLQKPAEKPIGK